MRKLTVFIFAILLLALAVWHDTVREGFNFPVATVIAAGFLLGMISPRKAWVWGLLAGIVIPFAKLAYVYYLTKQTPPITPVLPAVAPGLAAAYLGKWLREAVDRWRDEATV